MILPPALRLARHLLSVALFGCSWYFLKQWYLYQHTNTLLWFWFLFVAAILSALIGQIGRIRSIAPARLAAAGFLLILILPWGEWLRQGTLSSREEWTLQLYFQVLFLYGIFIVFSVVPVFPQILKTAVNRFFEFTSQKLYLTWIFPIAFFVFTSWIAYFVFNKTPIVQDSAAHLFQAEILHRLKLFAPAPQVPEFFALSGDMLVIHEGKWFGMYLPGFASLLALAMFVNAEWFVSPILGAASIAIWISYARRYHGIRTAVVFGVLALFSPFLFLMSSNVMVFTPELFVASSVIYLCRRQTEEESITRGVLLFLVMLFGILVRSFSLLPFLLPVLAYALWNRIRARSLITPVFAAAGIAAGAAILFWYQAKTTGDPFLPAYLIEYPDVGFGFGAHFAGDHTPLRSLENTSNSLLGINRWLNGWYSGSIIFIVLFIFFQRIEKWDALLFLSCVLLAGFYALFQFQDLVFGPRYFYCFAPVFLLMIARSIVFTDGSESLPAVILICLLSFFPVQFPEFVKKYDLSSTRAGYLKQQITNENSEKRLVFLSKNIPEYVNWNDPFLTKPVILVRDLGSRNAEAIKTFQDYRPSYYRLEITYDKKKLSSEYKFFDQPSARPAGFISLFELSMAIQMGKQYWTRDCFDIAYTDFFGLHETSEQIQFLQGQSRIDTKEPAYKKHFRQGLIHSGMMLLLPKLAFEHEGKDWENVFKIDEFRAALQKARVEFQKSGEVGSAFIEQFQKVEKRIDTNRDQILQNHEIINFLDDKVWIFVVGG